MNEQSIGEVAGEVWSYLERNGGEAELTDIRSGVKPRNGISVDLGTGWLAREGKLTFSADRGSITVGLRK